MNPHEPGFTKGHENQRDKKVPPILIEMNRRDFLVPPERFSGEPFDRACPQRSKQAQGDNSIRTFLKCIISIAFGLKPFT
ncbi:MAG: hypothetical protein HZA08_03745 [Nitrospirae bacterium]|nr:hypothetical protein [Nitrospirota bacterium]